uniref:Uncharacterized protein n=1 Tax=Candidatus Kentrum sp. LPFa TaxID=2126335 RepID=A0A450VYZ0_9GAMM|nr:MAG: hypothetical protein BECKLPF1236A_GA0070988_1003011 [Candidatus Kentron sp. LPFa]
MDMWRDPIIAEIHRTREKLSQAHGNDLYAIFLAARRGELAKALGHRCGNRNSCPGSGSERVPHIHPRDGVG